MSVPLTQALLINAIAPTSRISVTASASTSQMLPAQGSSLRVTNEGPNIVFISVGPGSQTAAIPTNGTNSTIVLPGADMVFRIPNYMVLQISAICLAAQTATIDVQVSDGS